MKSFNTNRRNGQGEKSQQHNRGSANPRGQNAQSSSMLKIPHSTIASEGGEMMAGSSTESPFIKPNHINGFDHRLTGSNNPLISSADRHDEDAFDEHGRDGGLSHLKNWADSDAMLMSSKHHFNSGNGGHSEFSGNGVSIFGNVISQPNG